MERFILLGLLVWLSGCGKGNEPYSVPGLTESLKSPDPAVRYDAVRHLGKYGSEAKDAVPALTTALADRDSAVRMAAAYALAKIGPEARDAVGALRKAARDKDSEVREAAVYALQQVQGKK